MDPLWNTVIVGGLQDGKPYLGYLNMIGVAFEENVIATGFGAHMAIVC
jgi:20S proteasome subunit beta 7